MQIPSRITEFLLVLTEDRITLLLVKTALLILGTFMDMAPLLMITRLAPRFGLDTDWALENGTPEAALINGSFVR